MMLWGEFKTRIAATSDKRMPIDVRNVSWLAKNNLYLITAYSFCKIVQVSSLTNMIKWQDDVFAQQRHGQNSSGNTTRKFVMLIEVGAKKYAFCVWCGTAAVLSFKAKNEQEEKDSNLCLDFFAALYSFWWQRNT